MPSRSALLLLLFTALLALVLWPPPAGAGTYELHSCRLPDGTPIPAAGWEPVRSAHPEATTHDTCATGGVLEAGFQQGQVSPERHAGWSFTAPTGTSIAAFTIVRSATSIWSAPLLSALEYFASD
jgi:hypothetical protein